MRILLATKTMDMGGIETSVVALARELRRRGHAVWVVSSGGELVPELERDGTPHVLAPLQIASPAGVARSARIVRRLIHDRGIDLAHSFSATASVALNLALRAPLPTRNGFGPVRLISSPMGLQNSRDERPLTTWLRNWFLALGAERILVISPEIRRHLERVGASDATLVDFNFVGLDLEAFRGESGDREAVRQEFGFPADAPLVSTIGALHPRKSHELFIEAAARIVRDEPAACFLVIGGGELRRDLERRARELGLGNRLAFAGVRNDLARLLTATDVYVKPGVLEGFIGITVLQALALGRPVVAFETEDVKLAVQDGVTGLLVPNADTAALAAQVVALLRQPQLGARLGEQGRQLVRERFHFGVLAERLERFYEQLVARVPAPALAH